MAALALALALAWSTGGALAAPAPTPSPRAAPGAAAGPPDRTGSSEAPSPGAPASPAGWEVPAALPGAEPFPPEVRSRIRRALAARAPGYRPHTRHLRADGSPLYTNRLLLETSPYLLQHAHNPVDWYPWGAEALAAARRLGRPIFLSIGYSTCHWCHVMERESFEDPEIAKLLNSSFVAIKVDREERPDLDAVYMRVVSLLTGGGGWPMTVVLTPDLEPFFAGTYFPPRAGVRGSRSGLAELLPALARAYAEKPEQVVAQAREITRRLRASAAPRPPADVPTAALIGRAVQLTAERYDERFGGFGGAPKFPRVVTLELLLRYHRRTGDTGALERVVGTLDHMARGGIRDHVGGGFHRYSTDRQWLVPHFEKMLYDNAQIARTYLAAHQVTGRREYAGVARETLDYLLREMRLPGGAFASATDADSPAPGGEEREGWFFTWTPAEIERALGAERARLWELRYGVTEKGSVEGRSVLHVARGIDDVARAVGLSPEQARRELEAARRAIFEARARRPPPARDDKVVAGWNGLAISALARASGVLGEPRYARAAKRAAGFLLDRMMRDGRLRRAWRAGRARGVAVLDDYAYVTEALIDLFEASGEARWLEAALSLQRTLDAHFADAERGGYFFTPDDAEELLVRHKPLYDGARPAGNSVAVSNLLRLAELTGRESYRRSAERALAAFAPRLERSPLSSPRMLSALDLYLDVPKEIVLVAPAGAPSAADPLAPFLAVLARTFLPNAVVVRVREGADERGLTALVPLAADRPARGGRATAYVCERRVCKLPTSDPAVFARQIAEARPYPPARPREPQSDRAELDARRGARAPGPTRAGSGRAAARGSPSRR